MSRRGSERGAIAIIVAIFALVMFTLAALVVDLGFARETRREAQNTADASALAGAGELYSTSNALQAAQSIAAVKQYAARNFGTTNADWARCNATVPTGWTTVVGGQPTGTTCIAYNSANLPKQVQVVVPVKHTGTFFGGIVGYRGSDISALAQASLQPDSVFTCVVCVLADYGGQNGSLVVSGGGLAVNGPPALGPNGDITATGVGFATPPGSNDIKGTVTPAAESIPPFGDPLAGLPLPGRGLSMPAAGWPSLGVTAQDAPASGACVAAKVYRTIDSCTTMAPGTYVVTESSKLAGNGNLTGTGVLLYMGCSDNSKKWVICSSSSAKTKGTIGDAGNGVYTLTPMSSGAYSRFTVIFDPDNDATYRQVGNGQSTLGGGVYGKSATIDNRGTGASKFCDDADPTNDKGCPMSITGVVVIGSISFSGQDAMHVTSDGGAETLAGPDALRLVK